MLVIDVDYLNARLGNFLSHGLSYNTLIIYARHWRMWEEFISNKKKGLYTIDKYLRRLCIMEQVQLIVLFIWYLHEIKNMTCNFISNAIAAVQYMFKSAFIDTTFFSSPIISLAKKACRPTQRVANLQRERQRRLPITCDMILWVRKYYWDNDIDNKMIYIAIALSFHFMLRSSEYISSRTNFHALRSEDIDFLSTENTRHKPWTVALCSLPILSAILVIRSSKSDLIGKGRYLHLGRHTTMESELLDDLIWWCINSQIQPADPLLCRYKHNDRRKLLTSRMISIAIKLVAKAFGFDSTFFASHSLRIGGMTTLIASGADRNVVRKIGGWSETSSCDLIYDRNTPTDRGTMAIESTKLNLSSSDIKRLLPPSRVD
jgi:hypothetical protein